MDRYDEIAHNLNRVKQRLREAEKAAGRAEGSVRLMPVTKFHPASDVEILRQLGVVEVGENREQEARAKAAEISGLRFAMIGQVQSKKANAVARWASACHSVDSVKLAEGLDRGMALALERGDRTTETMDAYIQVSYDGDTARGGCSHELIDDIADAIRSSQHLCFRGLMVVPPIGEEPERVFADVKGIVDKLGSDLELSAGMTGDMEAAVAAGSAVVRVGTAILGRRDVA